MDMILLLLCCVPETGVHSPSSRVQSDWAGRSDCHDLSCPTWHSSAPGEHRSQVRGCSGHCMCVAIGTPVTFFWPVLSSTVAVCCVLQSSVPTVESPTCVTKLHTHATESCEGKKKGSTSVSSVRHFAVRANCVSSHRPLRKSSCFAPFRFLLS
uniref:Secreted protein n=1 Tax=Rhipicephalus microplus TaxID=6941 RepID=A0A6G5A4P2_RHIMP